MMRWILAVTIILAVALQAHAYERFPIYVVDADGNPLTGQSIRAATAGSSPPDTSNYDRAVEVGAGEYYFKVGTGVGELPPGYYDVYRNGVLSPAWTNIYIGFGNVPPLNSITTSHIADATIRLNEDIDQSYGSTTGPGGTALTLSWDTKFESNGTEKCVSITGDDYGQGNYASKVSLISTSFNATGKDDDWSSPRCFDASLVSDPLYDVAVTDYAQTGPVGFYARVRCSERGKGAHVIVQRGDDLGSYTTPMEVAGYSFYVRSDSLAEWWNPPSTHQVAGVAGRVYAQRTPEAIGVFADVYADSSVPWAHGAHLRVYGISGTYPEYAYGVYTNVLGEGEVYGLKTQSWGKGQDARVRGLHVEAWQDTAIGQGDYIRGVESWAMSGAWHGGSQPARKAYGGFFAGGADTAYGIWAGAESDNTNAGNKAYGVYGSAAKAPRNYGVYGEALCADPDAENYGVYGIAANGGENWAGYFVGGVAADSLRIPSTATPGYAAVRAVIETDPSAGYGTGLQVKTTGTGATGIWLTSGSASDQYGLYISDFSGGEHAIYVSAGESEFHGPIIASAGINASTINVPASGSARIAGVATIPAGQRSVLINQTAYAWSDSLDIIVSVTPIGRPPNGSWCAASFTASTFRIYLEQTQTADQTFHWIIFGNSME